MRGIGIKKSLRVNCPAKINLFLRVLGLRSDGYHELETLFQAVDLRDELIIEQISGKSCLEVPGHPHLEGSSNLVMAALRWMERDTGSALSLRMSLIKRIPEAGGLGGGSSNAAGALLGINELLGLNLSRHDLMRGARSLGADVPFFLVGGAAVGEGVGERLTPVELPWEYDLLLVNPGIHVSTGTIFRLFDRTLTEQSRGSTLWPMLALNRPVQSVLRNDLQAVAQELHPQIWEIRARMADAGITASLMSGSGPTVFGIGDADTLDFAADKMPADWLCFRARPLRGGITID